VPTPLTNCLSYELKENVAIKLTMTFGDKKIILKKGIKRTNLRQSIVIIYVFFYSAVA